jgi:LmbE family N-acetylglucosaminyl deacetylase/SAM-dependent methyltransferase
VVTFSHRDAGTPESTWAGAGVGDLAPLEAGTVPGSGERLIVVAAHPDDESLGAAGLIHTALRRGATVHVIVCTAGEASHPGSPTHTPARLAAVRRSEVDDALRILHAGAPHAGQLDWEHLGLPDGQLARHADAVESAIGGAVAEGTAAGTRGAPAPRTVLAAPYRSDAHTDHDAAGSAAARVAAAKGLGLLEFPIWYWHWATPRHDLQWRHWRTLPMDADTLRAKRAVLAAHRSQVAALSTAPGDEALLSPGFQEHFSRPAETFRWSPPGTRDSGSAARIFDDLYRRNPDPWDYLGSAYERRKRAVTLASLPREHYESAIEAGCSIGVLTGALAERCGRLLGIDASDVALDAARERLSTTGNVSLLRADLPAGWPALPPGSIDLVVISEIGYFLAREELDDLLRAAAAALRPGGQLLLCHWRHPIEGWELDGQEVHTAARSLGWRQLVSHREEDFLLEVLQAPGEDDA